MSDRFNARSFLALAFGLALVALLYLSTRAPTPVGGPALFPPLQPLEPGARLIAQSDWGPADEGPNVSSEVAETPFGASTRHLASFTTGPHDRRLSLVLDYAGIDLEKPARPDPRRVMVVLNISLRCPQAGGGRCPEKQLDPFNHQKLFMLGEPENGSLVSRTVELADGPRELLIGHAVLRYDVAPNTPVVIDFSLSPGRGIHTRVLHTTLVTGDYLPPGPGRRPLGINRLGLVGAGAALLLFAGLAWRLRGGDDDGDPPRVLGVLLSLLGWAFAFAGLYGDLLYFLVMGIGVAFSGLLLFFGRAAALPLYGLVLAGVWIGSGLEVGPGFKPMLMRVGLLSLIGLYLFFGGVRDRLRRGGAGA